MLPNSGWADCGSACYRHGGCSQSVPGPGRPAAAALAMQLPLVSCARGGTQATLLSRLRGHGPGHCCLPRRSQCPGPVSDTAGQEGEHEAVLRLSRRL